MNVSRTRRTLAAGAALALLSIGVAGCAGSDGGDSASASSQDRVDSGAVPESSAGSGVLDAPAADNTVSLVNGRQNPDLVTPETDRALVRTGSVALRSDDVAQARFDVQKVVLRYGGEVSEDNTEADSDGEAERAIMVLRIPVSDFDAARKDLEGVGDLIDTSTSTDDVTTRVIDTAVRVRLQRRSIERISLLLNRAKSIRDIVSIEGELSRREADLGSLEKRQTYLSDQSAMSTITVSLERPPAKAAEKKGQRDDAGFLSGLEGGWHALTAVTVGALTVVGAVLPFALVALVVGIPLWVGRRRLLRRVPLIRPGTPAQTP